MLHRPWITPLVVVFWFVTSGWLFATKILPTLLPGSPPGYQSLYAPGRRFVPVAWTVHWNDMPVGWALMEANPAENGGMSVDSRLQLQRLPIDEMLPAWAGNIVTRMLGAQDGTLESTGRLEIDDEGRLRRFSSVVAIPGLGDRIVLDGSVGESEGTVRVSVRAGELNYETTRHLPKNAMIGDELSPQASMPGLAEGHRWTVPVYSPLRPAHSPLEVLHAAVAAEETLFWEDGLVRVHLVEYREDPTSPREPRCRLWVDRGGRVLKQESTVLGSRLAFVRRSDSAAARLAEELRTESIPGDQDSGP